jgi:hypothetical protein
LANLNVLAPLRIESFAYGGADTVIGAGRDRAQRSGAKLASRLDEQTAVALIGVAGALAPELRPGDLIIASELRSTESTTSRHLPASTLLTSEFRRSRLIPVLSSPRPPTCPAANALRSPPRGRWPSIWSRRGSWTISPTIHSPSFAPSLTPPLVDRCAAGYERLDRCRPRVVRCNAGPGPVANTRSSSPRRDRFAPA